VFSLGAKNHTKAPGKVKLSFAAGRIPPAWAAQKNTAGGNQCLKDGNI
jgi:hypothetical protein